MVANLIGIGVAFLVVTVAFPVPSVFDPSVRAGSRFAVVPAYIAAALWCSASSGPPGESINNVRWAIEERDTRPKPTSATRSSRRGG